MPNWTVNTVTFTAEPDVIQFLVDSNLDFHIIHPCPFITHEGYQEGWYDWCASHWGTKWEARDVSIISRSDTVLKAIFRTVWASPHGILSYLTKLHPSLHIVNQWNIELFECVGMTTFANGKYDSINIDPSLYTTEALKEFSKTNNWFDFEDFHDYMDDYYASDAIEKLQTTVVPQITSLTYEEFVELMNTY